MDNPLRTVAEGLIAVMTPFERMFQASEEAAQAARRRVLFRLPYDDPSRESRAREIHEADIHLRIGGVTQWLRSATEGLRSS